MLSLITGTAEKGALAEERSVESQSSEVVQVFIDNLRVCITILFLFFFFMAAITELVFCLAGAEWRTRPESDHPASK